MVLMLDTREFEPVSRDEIGSALTDLGLVIEKPILKREIKTAYFTSKLSPRAKGFDSDSTLASCRSVRATSESEEAESGLFTLLDDEGLVGASIEELGEKVCKTDLYTGAEKDIEEIIREKWGYLVMQFGGVFLTEVRPTKCFVGNQRLADKIVSFKNKKYGLDLQLLENYLKSNTKGPVQVHFSDIMFNPKIKDYDIFSITSGDVKKARIYLELARFLEGWNKGRETIIPIHLPYFESWKTSKEIISWGKNSENGKRDAVTKAESVLRDLERHWNYKGKKLNVRLALETGNGPSYSEGKLSYALIYEPHLLKFLMTGRENFVSICEDVGHLNLIGEDWTQYLVERIAEFHVSGNQGKRDEHTLATPQTLRNYDDIMAFLKFYPGNVCAEISKGNLTYDDFVSGVRNLAYTLFAVPEEKDFSRLQDIRKHVKENYKGEIAKENLNQERLERFIKAS